jgi:hypothetical protein
MRSVSPSKRNALREVIFGPVTVMSTIESKAPDQQRMTWTFWLDVLEVYPIEMVHSAFICFASLGGRYVSPPDIVAIIVEEQRKLGRAASEREAKKRWIVEEQEYAGRQRNRVTAEKAEEIIKEVGLKVRMPN